MLIKLVAALSVSCFLMGPAFGQSGERPTQSGRVVPKMFDIRMGKNILWKAQLGSMSYGGPVVANGKVYVGTNNGSGYLPRYPNKVDLGVLLCFDAKDGSFLWQASSEKLKVGRKHDWPLQGVTGTPTVEGDRLWYVTNRCELVCLDTEGFLDSEDDGDTDASAVRGKKNEADVVWKLDMIGELGASPHNASCSRPCVVGNRLFLVTGNGVDESHDRIPHPEAPSFIAVDKTNGQLLWTDASPGKNIEHGQWGSPQFGVLDGVPQVIFPGGDGWLYSFDPAGTPAGKGKLLWKFDCNDKDSRFAHEGKGNRNNLLGSPTIHRGLVYMATGQDPDYGEGAGQIWCIDPSKRGDVSPELVFNESSPRVAIAHKRRLACDKNVGDFTRPNPNSAAIWKYVGNDLDGDGQLSFEEEMHRSFSQIVIKDDLLFTNDFSGLLHCIDRKSGKAHWTYDQYTTTWASPLLTDNHIFVSNTDGDVRAFALSADPRIAMPGNKPVSENNARQPIYGTPTIDNNVMFLMTKDMIYAIADPTLK